MIYLDTNVLIYAFCKNVDNIKQQKISQNILKTAIKNKNLLLSEVILYEFAFVSKKLEEIPQVIDNNLEFLSKYVRSCNIYDDVIELMKITNSYKYSFDCYHTVFSNYFNAELITFDAGFKRFKKYSQNKITIL